MVVSVSVLSSSRSNAYNRSVAAHALMSNTMITPSPAKIASTTAAPANSEPPALASLSPEADRTIQIAQAGDVSRVTAAPNPEEDIAPAKKGPGHGVLTSDGTRSWTLAARVSICAALPAPGKQHGTVKDQLLLCLLDYQCSSKIGRHNSHILSANQLVHRPHRLRADASDATLSIRSGRRDI